MNWRFLKWLLPLFFLTPILWQAIFSNTPLVVATNFSKATPYFSGFLPEGRVKLLNNGVGVQMEPVYFDLLLPPRASSVFISLQTNLLPDNLRLGVRRGPGWDYIFPEQKLINGSRVIEVQNFPYAPDHYLRILVSAPSSGGRLIINQATAKIFKKPFNFNYTSELFNHLNNSFIEKFWNPTVNIIKPRYEE